MLRIKSRLRTTYKRIKRYYSQVGSHLYLYFASRRYKHDVIPFDDFMRTHELLKAGGVQHPFGNHPYLAKVYGDIVVADDILTCLDGLQQNDYTLSLSAMSRLHDYIATEKPQVILEFGCGVSTVCIATWMQTYLTSQNMKLYSVEQDEYYIQMTQKLLKERNLDHIVRFIHAPLTSYEYQDIVSECYDLSETRIQFLRDEDPIEMVLIDGPSGGGFNRLGTLFQLLPFLESGTKIFLDDAMRDFELRVADIWNAHPRIDVQGMLLTDRGLIVGTTA